MRDASGTQMEADSEQLKLKKLLVDLEDEHEHLQGTVDHLQKEIDKREIEIKKLLADRELQLAKNNIQRGSGLKKSQSVDFHKLTKLQQQEEASQKYSSEFVEQVSNLLEKITQKSEQVSALIKF